MKNRGKMMFEGKDLLPARLIVRSFCLAVLISVPLLAQESTKKDLSREDVRAAESQRLERSWLLQQDRVQRALFGTGLAAQGVEADGRMWEVIDVLEDGRLVVRATTNANAAISTGADVLGSQPAFSSVDGSSQIVGVWDGGRARETHQEFGARVMPSDTAGIASHASHVTGTIAASGVNSSAKGMAPAVTVRSFGWGSDTSEATSNAAATAAQQTTHVTLSNHSYGILSGWEFGSWSGTSGWHWWGSASAIEDSEYGGYGSRARSWDILAYNAPYYLHFRSAGNDRNDGPPATGETYYYQSGGWQSKAYDPATDPVEDGVAGGVTGYDCVAQAATAKNIVTVGATSDAVSGGVRNPSAGTIAGFSGRGPMDDGRIKPDIVANGVSLFSTGSSSDTSYYNSSGTSMSSPNATGTAALLRDLWELRLPGESLRASTLKGLILHTADDVGNPGPDYTYGWGYMNGEAAGTLINEHALLPAAGAIAEETINSVTAPLTIPVTADGGAPLVVTICWTDPAGSTKSGVDNPQADLVNDLDLRITRLSDGMIFLPWILDPDNPTAAATLGDNLVDNVEQVIVPSPGVGETYTVSISYKGTLTNSVQICSVLMSGGLRGGVTLASATVVGTGCVGGSPILLPAIGAAEGPKPGMLFEVSGFWAPPFVTGILAASIYTGPPSPLPDGCELWLNLGNAFQTDSPSTGLFGEWISTAFIPPQPALIGLTFRLQGFFPGAQTSWGWGTTPALECVIGN